MDRRYRYDGLYVIDDFNMEVGKAGFQVCKFALRRLPDQGLIPVQRPLMPATFDGWPMHVKTPSNESDSKDAGPTLDISSPSQCLLNHYRLLQRAPPLPPSEGV
ncbi:hypothetical protein QCA50_018469 [Cerrena zonata]|uniref:YDG domain-containing protein n=1 Tax=Cerrena zonata TaxID=2478898 RepID=A0AAW0FMU1_9APHY